jgi:hypothetical protein
MRAAVHAKIEELRRPNYPQNNPSDYNDLRTASTPAIAAAMAKNIAK